MTVAHVTDHGAGEERSITMATFQLVSMYIMT